MEDIYQENILDHYKNPRHFGELPKATHHVTGANLSCGDEITWHVQLGQNKIKDLSFTGRACAICTASASMLSEEALGQNLDLVKQVTSDQIREIIGIPLSPVRLKCALLPLETLKDLEKGSLTPAE